jgi:hypothetical protein
MELLELRYGFFVEKLVQKKLKELLNKKCFNLKEQNIESK